MSGAKISVRPVQPGDGQTLLTMTRTLAAHHGLLDRVTASAEDYERHLFCDKPLIGAMLAFSDDHVAGAAVWHRSFSTNSGREIIYLEDLTVLPDFRRQGIGQALMKALAQLAIDRGIPGIFWMAMGWNTDATAFYRQLGAEVHDNAVLCQIRDDALTRLATS